MVKSHEDQVENDKLLYFWLNSFFIHQSKMPNTEKLTAHAWKDYFPTHGEMYNVNIATNNA